MKRRILTAAAAWCAGAGLLADTIRFPDAGAGYATLQDALDAAQDGDVVEIEPGEYRGNFTVADTIGLTIKGLGPVAIDARPLGAASSGPALVVTDCPGLALERITFRNAAGSDAAGAGLRINGSSSVRLTDLVVTGCETYGILAQTSEGLRADDCLLRGNAGGLHVEGNLAEVRRVTVENDGLQGIAIFGDDATIEKSVVRVIRGGGGINISGARPTIRKCTVSAVLDAGTNGITTSGGNPDLRNNRVVGCDVGLYVVYGAEGVVKGNQFLRCSSSGLRLGGVSHTLTIEGNTIRQCGGPGVWVEGDFQLLADNVAEECGDDGFRVYGSSCVLSGNRAIDNLRDGIDVDASAVGTSLEGNVTKRNGAEGIDNGGADTHLLENVAKKNRIDFAEDGTSHDDGGNSFEVTGAPAPEID